MAPSGSEAPQVAHVPIAVVISAANTSWSMPPTALPSSIRASISTSRRSEALGLDLVRLVADAHERLGHGFHEGGGAAQSLRLARLPGRVNHFSNHEML
jgi:hypothetical protein